MINIFLIIYILAESKDELRWLLEQTSRSNRSTLTIWGQDSLSLGQMENLKKLISDIGRNRIFLDINSELMCNLLC
jgi:hypothetical protein